MMRMNFLPSSDWDAQSSSYLMWQCRVLVVLALACLPSVASAQAIPSVTSQSDVRDEQVFHLIASYQMDKSDLKESLETLIKLKISTLERRIQHLTKLNGNWLKLASELEVSANHNRQKSDDLEEQANTPSDGDKAAADIIVLSVPAAESLYLQCQSERQRISWEIAAETATLEVLKKTASKAQAAPNTAVLEGKVRVAEIALNAAENDLAVKQNLLKQNVISHQEVDPLVSQLQTRRVELDIAKAELRAIGEQATLSNTDAVVKSTINLAQLEARDKVLKTQIQQLAKAKHQYSEVEKIRSSAAAELARAGRYRDSAIEQQVKIDELESLKEALQEILPANDESTK